MKHAIMALAGLILVGAASAAHGPPQEHVTGYALGPPDAPVVVTEFSDFGCPYCAVFARSVFPELRREFIESGSVRWLHLPIMSTSIPNSDVAAHAAACAGDGGRFWAMHERLYERQPQWQNAVEPGPVFARYAREIGLPRRAFDACMAAAGRADVDHANEMAWVAGVRATPTFFINGRRLEGALPLDQWRSILRAEVEAAGPR
jgi:protein-disulfide isomerase